MSTALTAPVLISLPTVSPTTVARHSPCSLDYLLHASSLFRAVVSRTELIAYLQLGRGTNLPLLVIVEFCGSFSAEVRFDHSYIDIQHILTAGTSSLPR